MHYELCVFLLFWIFLCSQYYRTLLLYNSALQNLLLMIYYLTFLRSGILKLLLSLIMSYEILNKGALESQPQVRVEDLKEKKICRCQQ